jgi:hypothetical protein
VRAKVWDNLLVAKRQKKHWADLSPLQRVGVVALGAVELSLAGAAWADLAKRPASQVRGPKWRWALLIGLNVIGPVSYFVWGRRPAGAEAPQVTPLSLVPEAGDEHPAAGDGAAPPPAPREQEPSSST